MKKSIIIILFHIVIIVFLSSCRNSINEPPENSVLEEKPYIPIMMQIEYPSESLIFKAGERCDIKWVVTKGLDNVNLVLLKKFRKVSTIIQTTENDGFFSWVIPTNLPPSHHYRIKMIAPVDTNLSSVSYQFEVVTNFNPPVEK